MSDDARLTWASYAQDRNYKPKKLKAPRTSDLPMKLPPKQKLGRIYRLIGTSGRRVAIVASLLLAVASFTTAQLLSTLQTNPSTQAAIGVPLIQYMVLVDAETGADLMVLDQTETSLKLGDLPRRINLKPKITGQAAQVTYTTGPGVELTITRTPFLMSTDAGWEPIAGEQEFSVTPYQAAGNGLVAGQTYVFKLNFYE